jgi:diphthamide biosynthesis protein 3
MGAYYDEIEIEDMTWDDVKKVFHYPCPCGDRFEISKVQLRDYEDIATCPSCSLIIRVIYDPVGTQSPQWHTGFSRPPDGSLIMRITKVNKRARRKQ